MKDPILITGCARSGTSLIAGIINMSGAFGGNMSGPNRNNAKGMFENYRVRNSIVKPYLQSIHADPMGQYPLPGKKQLRYPQYWRKSIENIMISDGYKTGPWFYKGHKITLIWPVFNLAFPEARWLIVRRKNEDIVNSCIKTGFMRAFARPVNQRAVGVDTEIQGWEWWVDQHLLLFQEIQQALPDQVREIWPEKLVYEDYDELKEILDWLGLKWNPEILQFIDKKLWKAKQRI